MTQEQFENSYAGKCGVPPYVNARDWLRDDCSLEAIACDCGDPGCVGWRMMAIRGAWGRGARVHSPDLEEAIEDAAAIIQREPTFNVIGEHKKLAREVVLEPNELPVLSVVTEIPDHDISRTMGRPNDPPSELDKAEGPPLTVKGCPVKVQSIPIEDVKPWPAQRRVIATFDGLRSETDAELRARLKGEDDAS